MPFYEIDGLAPTLPESGRFWIAPDVQIVGDVRFGEDASVWFGSVLRGDNDSITLGAGVECSRRLPRAYGPRFSGRTRRQ